MTQETAEMVYRVALNCLRGGNPDRTQAHLRQLREAGYKTLAYRLCTRMIIAGITPCTEDKSRPIESMETPTP